MQTSQLIAFNLAALAAIASPGPALLTAIGASLRGGRVAGIATGCGLALMASLWTGLALLGLGALFEVVPWLYLTMKIGGGVYLLWIAWQSWRHAAQPVSRVPLARGRAFASGFAVNLANPKSVFFAAAVLVVIFPRDLHAGEMMLIVGNHFVLEVLVYTALATVMSTEAVAQRYLRAKRWLDRVFSMVLGALGLRLLFESR